MNRTLKLIQLHATQGDALWVNIDHVEVITASLGTHGGSYVMLHGDDKFQVRETPDQIVASIRDLEREQDTEGRPPPAVLAPVPKTDNLERLQMLILSSTHLSDALIRRLDAAAQDYPFLTDLRPGLLFSTICVVRDLQESLVELAAFPIPSYLEPVRPVLLFALARGFDFVLFDPDAEVVPELPVFEHR